MAIIEQKYPYITMWKDDGEDFIYAKYNSNLIMTLEIAKELVNNRVEFTGGKNHYIIIDFTNIKSVDKDAREYMNSTEGGLKGILGGAFLSNNIVTTVFINLYLKINKPCKPTKFFSNKEDGIAWLKEVQKSSDNK